MITAHYINPLHQYGKIEFDLVIGDLYRENKKFKEDVTDDELFEEVVRVLQELEIDTDAEAFEVIIDSPPSRKAE